MNIYFLTPKILIEGVSNVVSESLINNTNKQVFHGEDVGVNDCIGDDMLNEIDNITKNIVAHYRDNDGGVDSVEGDVVAHKFGEVVHPLYDIQLDYGGLNVKKDVATKVMTDFFGDVGDDNQDDVRKNEDGRG